MTTGCAFGISEDDIENVLCDYSLRVTNTQGKSFKTMASELIGEIDHARVEKTALKGGCDMDAQTAAAHEEIKQCLVELGVLEF